MGPISTVGQGVFPHQQFLDTNGVSCDSTQFNYLHGSGIRSHRFRAQSYKVVPTPYTLVSKSMLSLVLWPTGYKLEVPTTSFLGFNLLLWLTELRETFYLLDHQFITKWYNSGTSRWKMHKTGIVKGLRVSMPSPGVPRSPNLHVFTN